MTDSLSRSEQRSLRTFTVAEGILMLVLGILALLFPVITSVGLTAVVAVAFLVGGLVGWIHGLLRAPRLSAGLTFWRLVVSTLFVITGGWMLHQFRQGPAGALEQVAALALAIGIVFLAEGLVAIGVALSHRDVIGWGWGLTNGLVTLILGLLIVTMKFWNLTWVVGTLVGISFLFSGLDLLAFGVSFHPEEPKDIGTSTEA
ncbi:MAG: HdeD family acid-resistance protein [Cyanobacteriota bacterium]